MLLYPIYVVLGTLIMYSVMITLAATSVWLGRNQSLYDFWFYITNFARYPMEIYHGPIGGLSALDAHVPAAGAGGRQRAGPDDGQAVASRLCLSGRVCGRSHGDLVRRQPMGVYAGARQLSQREQLSGGHCASD